VCESRVVEKIRSTPRIPLKETGFDDFEFKDYLTTLKNWTAIGLTQIHASFNLFICSLFKGAVSNQNYISSNGKIISE